MDQDPKYPQEFRDIFTQIPEYEFYEPRIGRQWGYIENEALFPNEIDYDKTVYIKRSLPPPSDYQGCKYIALCYYYSKNLKAKSREGNPIFVAHYIIVPSSYNQTVQNYIDVPVYNPIANMSIPESGTDCGGDTQKGSQCQIDSTIG